MNSYFLNFFDFSRLNSHKNKYLFLQLFELKQFIERNVKQRFRGCNHPGARLLNRPQRQASSLSLSDEIKASLSAEDRVTSYRRSSSMTQLPILQKPSKCDWQSSNTRNR